MLHRVTIAVPRPEGAKRRIAENVALLHRHEDRVAGLPTFVEPGHPQLKAGKLFIPDRRRVGDRVIIDPQDAASICYRRVAYVHSLTSNLQPCASLTLRPVEIER